MRVGKLDVDEPGGRFNLEAVLLIRADKKNSAGRVGQFIIINNMAPATIDNKDQFIVIVLMRRVRPDPFYWITSQNYNLLSKVDLILNL